MTKTRPFAELKAKVLADPEGRAAVAAYKLAMEDALALSEFRARRRVERGEQDGDHDEPQTTTSRIEHEEDLYLATLRDYVVDLGGQLEVSVVFPDEKVTLVPTADESGYRP